MLNTNRAGSALPPIAELHLSRNLIAFGDRHLAHVVTEPAELCSVPVVPGGGSAAPGAELVLEGLVLPKSDHDFAVEAHSGHDEAVLTIPVRRLIQVHEVHVDGVPCDLAVVLSVEMEYGLAEEFQAVDPHLGRRERMAPGNQPNAVGARVG